MSLQIAGKWVWDFWFAQDGEDVHIFYLQADTSLNEPELRHWHVSIGHAVSQNLRDWTILPDALRPSVHHPEAPAWDDFTTWTGSIIQHEGLWYMFYTGSSRADEGLIQRIGLATSSDLIQWQKHPQNPLITADPAYYELLNRGAWHDQAWRDPYILRDEDGHFHALITARSKSGPPDARGVVAHAISTDLINWQVQPPLTDDGQFGHMEVPQIVKIGDLYYLIFCCPYEYASLARRERLRDAPLGGTFYMVSDSMLGPFRYLDEDVLIADRAETLYSGKLLQHGARWYAFAFYNYDADRVFHGRISDPMLVHVMEDGRLRVER